jgi:hypothetical protein
MEKDHMENREETQEDLSAARHSFVVRIWRKESNSSWRGWVQHTRTQKSTTVESLEALLDFMEQRAGSLTGTVPKNLR